jgi:protein CpxP
MNRVRSFTTAAALSAVLAGGVAFAQGGGRGPGGPGGRGFGGPGAGLPLRGLNLTEAQQQQVQAVRQQYREQTRTVAEKLRAAFDAQRQAVEAVPADESAIRATTQSLAEAQTEMALQQARVNAEIYGLLTPEQQTQLKKLQAERKVRAQQQRQRQRGQQRPPRQG